MGAYTDRIRDAFDRANEVKDDGEPVVDLDDAAGGVLRALVGKDPK